MAPPLVLWLPCRSQDSRRVSEGLFPYAMMNTAPPVSVSPDDVSLSVKAVRRIVASEFRRIIAPPIAHAIVSADTATSNGVLEMFPVKALSSTTITPL